ncbi:MAG: hypothetical protein MZV70_56670 [Desulfobacterales bacterium]|nr:hypothetical protein [Desulfobacterales bacterium]
MMFRKLSAARPGLADKGYTLHCLRHTCATRAAQCRHAASSACSSCWGTASWRSPAIYARLTDKTREEEYFKAMAIIEAGRRPWRSDRCDHRLPTVSEAQELLRSHGARTTMNTAQAFCGLAAGAAGADELRAGQAATSNMLMNRRSSAGDHQLPSGRHPRLL